MPCSRTSIIYNRGYGLNVIAFLTATVLANREIALVQSESAQSTISIRSRSRSSSSISSSCPNLQKLFCNEEKNIDISNSNLLNVCKLRCGETPPVPPDHHHASPPHYDYQHQHQYDQQNHNQYDHQGPPSHDYYYDQHHHQKQHDAPPELPHHHDSPYGPPPQLPGGPGRQQQHQPPPQLPGMDGPYDDTMVDHSHSSMQMDPVNEDTAGNPNLDLTQFDKDIIFDGLKRMYRKKILPLELSSKYGHFHSPPLSPSDFDSKPMVLLLGQYSVGKTSFIKYLLGRDFPGIRVGPEPTTDRFVSVMLGDTDKIIPGAALCSQVRLFFKILFSRHF